MLKEGGNETVTKCHALKMIAPDGRMRKLCLVRRLKRLDS